MNIMRVGQTVLSQSASLEKKNLISFSPKPDQVFGMFRQKKYHGNNAMVFLVSFLTYLLSVFPTMVYALPLSGSVKAGSATINQVSKQKLNIQQGSNKAIIDWRSFSIASGEHVDFQIPSSNGITLNRVTGNDPSSIFGKLTSNGNLMLINRNGILFGSGSEIDVHSLIATTSDISNNDFINGKHIFNVAPEFSNAVINKGTITAAEGGLVAFVAPGVQNTGIINARLGKVSLAAGHTFTLDLYGDQLVSLGVNSQVVNQIIGADGKKLNALISNSGSIFADGGIVSVDVQTAQSLIDNVVNMSGHIQARSIAEKNGSIYLTGGDNGLVSVSGSIDGTGLNIGETGGVVHILGNKVGLYDYASIDVSGDAGGGLILIGGDYQGLGSTPTAVENYIGPNVSIFADAITRGHGGRTIFWADRRTEFFGTVRARGGRFFGDGGFVEVSGKEELYFDGSVDTTAANGKSGTLLLDPDNITVQSGSGTASASGASSFTTYQNILEAVSSTTNIDLVATRSITLNNSLSFTQTNGQSVTFTATTGNIFQNPSDTITTSGGSVIMAANQKLTIGTLSTNGGDITLTGADLNLSGSLNAGVGALTIKGVSGGTIGLDGSTASTTNSTVSNICNNASCDMTLVQSELSNMQAGSITIGDSSSGDLYVDGVTITHISGGVTLNSIGPDGSVEFGTTDSTLRNTRVNANDDIIIYSNLTTEGASTFNADFDADGTGRFAVASGKTLASLQNKNIAIVSSGDIGIVGSISSGTGQTTISTANGGTIGVGGASGNSTIDAAELSHITAGTLNIGNSSTGNITVDGVTAANSNNATTVNFNTASGSSVSFANNNSTFNALTVSSESVSFGSGLTIATDVGKLALNSTSISSAGALTLSGATGIDFGSGVALTAGGNLSMSTTSGGITGAGAFTLTSTGDISLTEDFTTAGATIITADSDGNGVGDFSLSNSKVLSSGNSALALTANDITLSGSISSGTGSTTIVSSDSGTIGIGGTTGNMTITGTELGNITAGTLNIGNSSTGNITVDGVTAANSNNATTVNFNTASGSSVSFANNASTFKGLLVSAGNGINQSVNLTTSSAIILGSDSNDDGSGGFNNTAGSIYSGGKSLSITGSDFSLSGLINTGTGNTSVNVSNGGSIGLGSTAGNMTISGAELAKITAGTLTIGDSSAGAMTVDGISSSNSNNISNLDLNASSITFSSGGSTFKGLSATAYSGAISGTAALTVSGNSTFTSSGSNQSISLTDTSNSFTGAVSLNTTGSLANVTLNSNNDLILNTSTIGGNQSVTVSGTSQTLNIAGTQNVGGTINLQSSGEFTLTSSLLTSSGSDSAITLTSTGGGIFDGDSDSSVDIQSISGRLVAISNGGFGTTANPIDTTLGSLDLINSLSGDVNIYETDSLEINRITQNVNNKNITVSYSGNLNGHDKAVIPNNSLGMIAFIQRQQVTNSRDQILEGTGKSLATLSLESTVQLAKTVESNAIQMIFQNNDSDGKTVANFDNNGSKGPYRTDVFNKPYALVEFSKDAKENFDGPPAMENFWGKSIEETQVVKLELNPSSRQKRKLDSKKTRRATKETLWRNMIQKVGSKKSKQSGSKEKIQKKTPIAPKVNLAKSKTRRPGTSNLAPVLETRPFESGNFSVERSFR